VKSENLELVRPVRLELTIDPVQRAWGGSIGNGRAKALATHHATQTQSLHQPFDGATSYLDALPIHLFPDFVRAVDLHVGLPDTLDLGL